MHKMADKLIKYFYKYDISIAINKTTVFDHMTNNKIQAIRILNKSGVYNVSCEECNTVHVGVESGVVSRTD